MAPIVGGFSVISPFWIEQIIDLHSLTIGLNTQKY